MTDRQGGGGGRALQVALIALVLLGAWIGSFVQIRKTHYVETSLSDKAGGPVYHYKFIEYSRNKPVDCILYVLHYPLFLLDRLTGVNGGCHYRLVS